MIRAVRGLREKVAEGVQRRHRQDCARSRGGSRCTCQPTYVARLRIGTTSRERTFPSLSAAAAWREGAATGTTSPGVTPTLGEGATAFLVRARDGRVTTRSGRPYAAATLAAYESALRVRVLPTTDPVTGLPLGDMPADRLTEPRALQRVVTALRDGGASSESVRSAVAAVRAVLAFLYEAGFTDALPPRVAMPPPAPRRERVLTDAEVAALLDAAAQDDRERRRSYAEPLLRLIAGTGLRVSEALALTWGDGLTIEGGEAVVRVTAAKTPTGVREVLLMDPQAVAALRAHRLATGRPDDGAPVFSGSRQGAARTAMRRVVAAAGVALLAAEGQDIPDDAAGRTAAGNDRLQGVGFHTLRHTHATNLGTNPNVDAATLAARLGHADPSFTARRYVHARDDRARDLARIAAGL